MDIYEYWLEHQKSWIESTREVLRCGSERSTDFLDNLDYWHNMSVNHNFNRYIQSKNINPVALGYVRI